MKQLSLIIGWIGVIAIGAFLRLDSLETRPFHADEATGARITAKRMERQGGSFDPTHFHGPLLAEMAIPVCRAMGEPDWKHLTKGTLRLVPAAAGILMLCIPWFWRRRIGDAAALLAAALLATSPLLVYYSRMFIHEIPLTLFGVLALTSLTRRKAWAWSGVWVGLMFALKESVAISGLAWVLAGIWIAIEQRSQWSHESAVSIWRKWRVPLATATAAAIATAGFFYTDGLRHPQGAWDAVRTFFVYETVPGHDKGAWYYIQLLGLPKKTPGAWWFETGVLLLALAAYAGTFLRKRPNPAQCALIRFLAYSALFHGVIYSLFSYKTPWLACLPWAHVCLLAACAPIAFRPGGKRFAGAITAVLALATLATQFHQSRLATGRFASNARNPYAYVPTQRDVELLDPWLLKLRACAPDGSIEPIAVVGSAYWPLPWYLRSFERIGYWKEASPEMTSMPVVFSTQEASESAGNILEATHIALPRGLRDEAPLTMWLRNDLWKKSQEVSQ